MQGPLPRPGPRYAHVGRGSEQPVSEQAEPQAGLATRPAETLLLDQAPARAERASRGRHERDPTQAQGD
jgi:hypothetical protein